MPATKRKPKLEALLEREDWGAARALIEAELVRKPDDHWLLTQLGVTYYEEQRYRDALVPLLKSLGIMPDCPLTLWNLAGTHDALGEHAPALEIYTRLLRSKTMPADDPCWESREWADALKADCAYRSGAILARIGDRSLAKQRYRQYLEMLNSGASGTYSVQDVHQRLGKLYLEDYALLKTAAMMRKKAGTQPAQGGRRSPIRVVLLPKSTETTRPSAPKPRRAAPPSAPPSPR